MVSKVKLGIHCFYFFLFYKFLTIFRNNGFKIHTTYYSEYQKFLNNYLYVFI